MNISTADIKAMEQRYRGTFINSLPGFKCLNLVATIGASGAHNLGLFSSTFHIGANPPLLGLVFRPESSHHDTLTNIKQSGFYTLNNVLPSFYEKAHLTSARYESGVSEFEACGLTPEILSDFQVPFVAESTIKIGLELRETINLSINNTTIVIGEIIQIQLSDEVKLSPDGYVDHISAQTVTVAGLDSYFSAEALGRLAYAKPNIPAKRID